MRIVKNLFASNDNRSFVRIAALRSAAIIVETYHAGIAIKYSRVKVAMERTVKTAFLLIHADVATAPDVRIVFHSTLVLVVAMSSIAVNVLTRITYRIVKFATKNIVMIVVTRHTKRETWSVQDVAVCCYHESYKRMKTCSERKSLYARNSIRLRMGK